MPAHGKPWAAGCQNPRQSSAYPRNVVHNLARIEWHSTAAHPWALAFENRIKQLILAGDHQSLIDYRQLPDAELAVPTPEHYLPLLYILGLQGSADSIEFFNDQVTLGAISMLSF